MQSRDFCYWLQGFFELGGEGQSIDAKQAAMIRAHLDMVFRHELRADPRPNPFPTPEPPAREKPVPAPEPPPAPKPKPAPPPKPKRERPERRPEVPLC